MDHYAGHIASIKTGHGEKVGSIPREVGRKDCGNIRAISRGVVVRVCLGCNRSNRVFISLSLSFFHLSFKKFKRMPHNTQNRSLHDYEIKTINTFSSKLRN